MSPTHFDLGLNVLHAPRGMSALHRPAFTIVVHDVNHHEVRVVGQRRDRILHNPWHCAVACHCLLPAAQLLTAGQVAVHEQVGHLQGETQASNRQQVAQEAASCRARTLGS